MGKRDKKLKGLKFDEASVSEEEDIRKVPNSAESIASDDDEEANEDLSLKIVQKSLLRCRNKSSEFGIVTDLKKDEKKREKKKKKKKKIVEAEVPEHVVEIDKGFKDFCGELFLVDNVKDEEKLQPDEVNEISDKAVETDHTKMSDNAVMRKLLRGPRYFDPPDSSWGACYNCGEEGHVTVNCTSARRKKPCFVCGSFEHNARLCTKGRDCFICKQKGHRAKDCPEKYSISKMCLKCGDLGHEMYTCENDYSPDDLQEIQCYVCNKFGHLCCVDYGSPNKGDVSCYKCGHLGHTGLACTMSNRGNINGTVSFTVNTCYRCSEGGHFARDCPNSMKGGDSNFISSTSCYKCDSEGHFARECPNVSKKVKSGKRIREPSTPKLKSSKKIEDHKEVKSAPTDIGKSRRKKFQQEEVYSPVKKTKQHRGGWIPEEDPPEYNYNYNKVPPAYYGRSPSTPIDRRNVPYSYDESYEYGSSSHPRNRHRLSYDNYSPNSYGSNNYAHNNYASNRSSGLYQYNYSASRFGNNSNGGMRGNYDRW